MSWLIHANSNNLNVILANRDPYFAVLADTSKYYMHLLGPLNTILGSVKSDHEQTLRYSSAELERRCLLLCHTRKSVMATVLIVGGTNEVVAIII